MWLFGILLVISIEGGGKVLLSRYLLILINSQKPSLLILALML